MNLQESIFSFTKSVQSTQDCQKMSTLIESLNSFKENSGKEDRSNFGYIARRQYLQILGYILVHQHREEMAQKIPMISEEELDLFVATNNLFLKVNMFLTDGIAKEIDPYKTIINPYSLIQFNPIETKSIINLYSHNVLENLRNSFMTHPALVTIINNPPIIEKDHLPNLMVNVQRFQKQILDSGVHNVPESILKIQFTQRANARVKNLANFVSSLTILRTVNQIIDQLFYQAIISKKLSFINTENLISIKRNTSNTIGKGLTCLVIIDKNSWLIEPNDIVLIDGKLLNTNKNTLGWVQNISFTLSEDMGNTQEITMWLLDDNLNPFMNLLM